MTHHNSATPSSFCKRFSRSAIVAILAASASGCIGSGKHFSAKWYLHQPPPPRGKDLVTNPYVPPVTATEEPNQSLATVSEAVEEQASKDQNQSFGVYILLANTGTKPHEIGSVSLNLKPDEIASPNASNSQIWKLGAAELGVGEFRLFKVETTPEGSCSLPSQLFVTRDGKKKPVRVKISGSFPSALPASWIGAGCTIPPATKQPQNIDRAITENKGEG